MGVNGKGYMLMKLPTSMKVHIKVIVVSLVAANGALPSLLYTNPMVPLVATLAIFKATLNSNSVILKGKEQVLRLVTTLPNGLQLYQCWWESIPAVATLVMPSCMERK